MTAHFFDFFILSLFYYLLLMIQGMVTCICETLTAFDSFLITTDSQLICT